MVQRFCGKCGVSLNYPTQKFCTSCGAAIPLAPETISGSPSLIHGDIPRWLKAVAGIVLVLAACVVLVPLLTYAVPSLSSAVSIGTSGGAGLASPAETPLTGLTPISVSSSPPTSQIPEPAATTPITLISTIETPPPTITPLVFATPVPTNIPVTHQTPQITLSVTQVPPQPPASSYASSTPGAPSIDPTALEARIHELINVQREQNGLSALSYDPFLADIARGHSYDMVTRNFFDHVNPDGKHPKDRGDDAGYPCIRYFKSYYTLGIAENLFQGNRYSAYTTTNGVITSYDWNSAEQVAQTAVSGWMNSSGHRKNILTETFELEGIGVAFAPDDKIYVTENFC